MTHEAAGPVIQLDAADVPRVVDVLAEAFHAYPVMRFVLGETPDYAPRLATLIRLFVMARALREEPMFGVADGSRLVAVALVSYPHRSTSPPAFADLREAVWGDLGAEARARYEACGRAWSAFAMAEPHVHVNMLGVRPRWQGRGLARRLLAHVHGMAGATPGSAGVTLTTEDHANVPFYEKAGYEVRGHARIAPALETWGLFARVPGPA